MSTRPAILDSTSSEHLGKDIMNDAPGRSVPIRYLETLEAGLAETHLLLYRNHPAMVKKSMVMKICPSSLSRTKATFGHLFNASMARAEPIGSSHPHVAIKAMFGLGLKPYTISIQLLMC
jgi:hypothetical protein